MTCCVRGAAIFCKNKDFQRFLSAVSGAPVEGEAAAALALCLWCGIQSRRELRDPGPAQESYKDLVRQFNRWATAERG